MLLSGLTSGVRGAVVGLAVRQALLIRVRQLHAGVTSVLPLATSLGSRLLLRRGVVLMVQGNSVRVVLGTIVRRV